MSEQHRIQVHPIPAFKDNYIWALRSGSRVAIVDPGDGAPTEEPVIDTPTGVPAEEPTVEETIDKCRVVVEAAKKVRAELAKVPA